MIDSSKTPMPLWRRYATLAALTLLVLVAAYVVWVKELHHSTPSVPTPSAVSHAAVPPAHPTASTTTTLPGGLPVSSRNPFGK